MSRIGKKPIPVPQGATATVEGQNVRFKGPKGELSFVVHEDIEVKLENGEIKVDPRTKTQRARSMWGLSRTMVQNLATGVTTGFERKLEIEGVGYRASVQGKNLVLALGYSHDVNYAIPQGVTITPDGRYLFLSLSKQAKVAIIDLRTRQVVGHLDAGQAPDGVVYSRQVIDSPR